MNQKRVGIILSYVNLCLNMIINVVITPFLIHSLGDVDYSIYKVIQSFAGPLSMFNLGISTIVVRAIVKNSSADKNSKVTLENTLAQSFIASGIMSVAVVCAAIFMYCSIPSIYGKTYSPGSVYLGQKLFIMFVGATILRILTDGFNGCIVGHEKFSISSGIPLFSNLIRIALYYILLTVGWGVIGVVFADLLISFIVFIFSALYSLFKLHEIPHFYYLDKMQVFEMLSFGFAILLQAIVNQVNNNVDTMILGAYVKEKSIITMYSSALAIYGIYNSLISVIANFFLPQATALTDREASGKELTNFVIRPGRFQAIISVATIAGFFLYGKEFISMWIGEQYSQAYYVTLMLMIPVTIPLVENAAICILDATLKRVYRSVVLVIMAIINVAISLLLIQWIDFWGAALGTVISLLVGHGILMNYYYHRTYKMEIFRMFKEIFSKIVLSGVIACVPCFCIRGIAIGPLFFILKCLLFLGIYSGMLWLYGLSDEEKKVIEGMMSPLIRIIWRK